MTVTAIVLELDGLLFDTDALRARALHASLQAEGVHLAEDAVARAHRGVTAVMALDMLHRAAALDDTGRELVLRRTTDAVRAALERALPRFDPPVARALESLAALYPLAVVTRATRADAEHMLQQAQLATLVRTVRSLDGCATDVQPAAWAAAVAGCAADRGVAVAPARLLAGARAATLATIESSVAALERIAADDGTLIDSFF